MIFKFHKDIISVTEQGELLPEIKEVKKKPNYRDIIEYTYWNYDRTSLYFSIILQDRLKVVHTDHFNHLNAQSYKQLDKDAEKLIRKLDMLQFTSTELLIEGMNKKIDAYLQFWNSTDIKEDNHKLISDQLERAESLLKMKERLTAIVNKENATKRMGNQGSTLIETLNQDK